MIVVPMRMHNAIWSRSAVLVAALAAMTLTGCSVSIQAGGPPAKPGASASAAEPAMQRFSAPGFGISFDYPDTLVPRRDITIARDSGTADSTKQTIALALDEINMLVVRRSILNLAVTPANLEAVQPEFDAAIARLDSTASRGIRLGGGELPGLEYQVRAPGGERSRYLVFFDGPIQYTLNCQYTETRRTEIATACETARSSLHRV